MKAVILDAKTVVGDDLDFSKLQKYADFEIYQTTDEIDAARRIGDAQAVFTNKVPIDEQVLRQCPNLKYIGVFATGYNIVDTKAAEKRGVVVANVPAYSTDSVAQHTFAMILDAANHIALHSEAVKAGEWQRSKTFCFWKTDLFELSGKTIGIIGYGAIGKRVAEIARAFKMKVLYTSRSKVSGAVTLDELLAQSDFVSLHCPLTAENQKMINAERLNQMKKTAILINTARGGLVDEQAVADALNGGIIARYYADAVSVEPIVAENPLLSAKNCVLTPHIAWAPKEARQRLISIAADNFAAFLAGNPVNNVAGKN